MSAFDKAWKIVKEVKYTEGGMHSCPACEGRGMVQFNRNNSGGNPIEINAVKCQTCKGLGQVDFSALANRAEAKADECTCPEMDDKVFDRYGKKVPGSIEQLQDWIDGLQPMPDGSTRCGTCNGVV